MALIRRFQPFQSVQGQSQVLRNLNLTLHKPPLLARLLPLFHGKSPMRRACHPYCRACRTFGHTTVMSLPTTYSRRSTAHSPFQASQPRIPWSSSRTISPAKHLVTPALLLCVAAGCGSTIFSTKLPALGPAHAVAPPQTMVNPLFITAVDQDFLWNELVDTVDDYFRIEREQRMRQIGDVLTEGQLDTIPTVGSTLLEPWRSDSVPGYEKLHSTLQSIRRRATVRVTPEAAGYLIFVHVAKELEAVDKPEHASVGTSLIRHDETLISPLGGRPRLRTLTAGWIPLGRDVELEQRIISELCGRLTVK